IGSHHLEYGFPSTHSTNSISIALFLFALIHQLAFPPSDPAASPLAPPPEPSISPTTFTRLTFLLLFYAFSIVFGRLYTAMHTFTDCVMGITLGTLIWWWVNHAGWEVPLILIPLCLLAVNQHPQPVDDCPCFEDAIAFGSVLLGFLVGRWGMVRWGGRGPDGRTGMMPGSGWVWVGGEEEVWVGVERGWEDVVMWWSVAVLKMVVGIIVIFSWRILAKSLMHLILPPTYRLLSRVFKLPHRRFYTPATEYNRVPSEFLGFGAEGAGLRTVPSVIDLPGTVMMGSGGEGESRRSGRGGEVKMRGTGTGTGVGMGVGVGERDGWQKEKDREMEMDERKEDKDGQPIRHYDADVLTKLVVYSGIAVLVVEMMPALYDVIGWGVRSTPV
ncbi:hypothetical protein AMATHDRAFT_152494, partial [Amanita thiersii Skay4041]